MTPEEWKAWSKSQREARDARKVIVLLFVLTLLGLPAPLLGPVAGVYAWKHRRLLAGADGTYLAMGYGAAALGATYLLILVPLLRGS